MLSYEDKDYIDRHINTFLYDFRELTRNIINKSSISQTYDDTIHFSKCHVIIVNDIVHLFKNEPKESELKQFHYCILLTNIDLYYNKTKNYISITSNKDSACYNIERAFHGQYVMHIGPNDSEYFEYKKRFPTGELVFINKSSWFGLVKWKEIFYKIDCNDVEKCKINDYEIKSTIHNIKKFIEI